MSCMLDYHEKPRMTGTKFGVDRHGNEWSEEYWVCDECGKRWTVSTGLDE